MENILSLTKKFISIPSTKDNPKELSRIIECAKEEVSDFRFKYYISNNKPSLFIYNTTHFPKKFKLILNAHLDVVPGIAKQYQPYEKLGKLYGRGAADMKAAAATMIYTFNDIAKKINYPLGLQVTTDEEVGGYNGTAHQIAQGINADFVISGESTNLGINSKAKGILLIKITAKGKSGHSAYPWNGKNALWMLNQFLTSVFNTFPTPEKEAWVTTVNLAKIETDNTSSNKIPSSATALLNIRYIPEETDMVVEKIKSLQSDDIKIDILGQEPPQFTNENSIFINTLKDVVKKTTGTSAPLIVKHGASDVRHYNKIGTPGVVFGPTGSGLHGDDEWVDIRSLTAYHKILKTFIQQLESL
jgi:succinyl-diaminopimelate desuccinylase